MVLRNLDEDGPGPGGGGWPKGIKVCHFVERADGNGSRARFPAPPLAMCKILQIQGLRGFCGIPPGERLARDLLWYGAGNLWQLDLRAQSI